MIKPTCRPPGRWSAFGLIDAVVGIVILALVAVVVHSAMGTLGKVVTAQSSSIPALWEASDETPLRPRL